MIHVRPARREDAGALAPRLRRADLLEIRAYLGEDPLTVLRRGVDCSDPCHSLVGEDGVPIAIFGVVPDAERRGVGSVWLLASTDLAAHRGYFLRNSRPWVDALQRRYRVLWNHVDARNEEHIRWLQWCGFTFLRLVEEFGCERRPFYEFQRLREPQPSLRGEGGREPTEPAGGLTLRL